MADTGGVAWLILELRSIISASSHEHFWNSGNTYFRVDSPSQSAFATHLDSHMSSYPCFLFLFPGFNF